MTPPKQEAALLWLEWDWLVDEPDEDKEFFHVWDLNGFEVVRGHKQNHVLTVGHGPGMKARAIEIASELTRLASFPKEPDHD